MARHSFCKGKEPPRYWGCPLRKAHACACEKMVSLRAELRTLIANAESAGYLAKYAQAELKRRGLTPKTAEIQLKTMRREWGRM